MLLASLAFAFLRGVVFKRLETGDEGVNGTMAHNICHSLAFLVRPSYVPGGSADWLRDDLQGMSTPPFHPALLALAECPFDGRPEAMGLLSFFALLATLFFLHRFVALWDSRAALLTTLLFALSPAILQQFRYIELEPVLTAWGMAGTYWIARGESSGRKGLSFLGGACLGLGFLTKLWLVTPFVFASLGLLAATRLRQGRWRIASPALVAAGFLITASLHLLLIALRAPSDLPLWLRQVYFSPFLAPDAGQLSIGASKLSGESVPPEWLHPFWYYPAILYRAHFFLIPILLGCLPALCARSRLWIEPLAAAVAGLASLIPLSFPVVKEPLYILATCPFLYALAGLGLSALWWRLQLEGSPRIRWERLALHGAGALAGGMAVALAVACAKGLKRNDLTPVYVAGHALAILSAWFLVYAAQRQRWTSWLQLTAGLGAVTLAGFIAYDLRAPVQPYKEIAGLLRPYLEAAPPERVSFISPDYKILQLYLFRNGRYWRSFFTTLDPKDVLASLSSGQLCGMVIGPEERAEDQVTVIEQALEARGALDLSARLPPEARGTFRILVNNACRPAGSGR